VNDVPGGLSELTLILNGKLLENTVILNGKAALYERLAVTMGNHKRRPSFVSRFGFPGIGLG
jgi:hypothetical protein